MQLYLYPQCCAEILAPSVDKNALVEKQHKNNKKLKPLTVYLDKDIYHFLSAEGTGSLSTSEIKMRP